MYGCAHNSEPIAILTISYAFAEDEDVKRDAGITVRKIVELVEESEEQHAIRFAQKLS